MCPSSGPSPASRAFHDAASSCGSQTRRAGARQRHASVPTLMGARWGRVSTGLRRPGVTYHPWRVPPSRMRQPAACAGGSCSCIKAGAVRLPAPFRLFNGRFIKRPATRANSLPESWPKSPAKFHAKPHVPFHGRDAVRCRVREAFLHYFWTPECTAFCPESCPDSRCTPVARADVRRRHNGCFEVSRRRFAPPFCRCRGQGQDPARRKRSLKSFWARRGETRWHGRLMVEGRSPGPGSADLLGKRQPRDFPTKTPGCLAGRELPQHKENAYHNLLNLSNSLQ